MFSNDDLLNLHRLNIPYDFVFNVDGQIYECHKVIACLNSEAVSTIIQSDPTTEEFKIDMNDTNKYFNEIVKAFYGEKINFTKENCLDYIKFGKVLGNKTILNECEKIIESTLTKSNVYQYMDFYIDCEVLPECIIKFIAQNFKDLKKELVEKEYSVFVIDKIFKLLPSPDVNDLIFWIDEYTTIHGNNGETLLDLIDGIEKIQPKDIFGIMGQLKSPEVQVKFIQKTSAIVQNTLSKLINYSKHRIPVPKDVENDKYKGVFGYLWSVLKENPMTKGVININVPTNTTFVSDLIEFGENLRRHYKNDLNDQTNDIIFDFKDMRISVEGYAITSCYCHDFGCWPKDWKIEGSNNCSSWCLIDKREDQQSLKGRYRSDIFKCRFPSDKYRYIRYTQLGNFNTKGLSIIHLSAFEFFGELEGIIPTAKNV